MEFLNLTHEEMKDILIKLLENLQMYCDKEDELKYRSAVSQCYQQNNTLSKGIDELIEKLSIQLNCYYKNPQELGDKTIQDLKKLKGE